MSGASSTSEARPVGTRRVESGIGRDSRRAFLGQGLALGAGLVGVGCLADTSTAVRRASMSARGAPQAETRGTRGGAVASDPLRTDLREVRFDLEVDGRVVPGLLWRPTGAGPHTPLVLAGHGGGFGTAGHKRSPRIVALARALAEQGIATAAIDQPGCGDRPGAAEEQARRRQLTIEEAIATLWTPALVEEHAREWQASLAHLSAEWNLGRAGLGYWGLSGGTTFGLPLVALESRIEAAVLGLNSAVPLMLRYASRVTCPVLYTMNLDDHFMSRDAGLALFDALATRDKFVLAYPGDHGENLDPATDHWARFFARRLGVE